MPGVTLRPLSLASLVGMVIASAMVAPCPTWAAKPASRPRLAPSLAPIQTPVKAPSAADSAKLMARVKANMDRIGGRFRDMDTIASLAHTPPKASGDAAQNREMTMTAHLFIKMPDKVKFQVLNSNFPLFNRWIFLQSGDAFAVYDPISDRRIRTDFRKLTGRDPARVDTSMAVLGLLFDPARYRFQWLGASTRAGAPVYHVRLKHKVQARNLFMVVDHTDLYVDTQRLMPVYSASYDQYNNLITTGDFRDVRQTPVGWVPTRITITDHEFERLRKKRLLDRARNKIAKKLGVPPKEGGAPDVFGHRSARDPNAFRNGTLDLWIGWQGKNLYPWKMLANAPDGSTSLWTFSDTKLNTGLKDAAFKL